MGGVSLGTDDDGAKVQVETGPEDIAEFFLEKGAAVRLVHLMEFQLRREQWAPLEDRCFHYSGRERCKRHQISGENFCREHIQAFQDKSNQVLLEAAAEAFRKATFPADSSPPPQLQEAASADFANYLSALGARGYNRDDVERALRLTLGWPVGHINPNGARQPKWRDFERLAFGIYLLRAEGAEVTFDETVIGKLTGRPRQIDVSVRFKRAFSDYHTMVECKDERVSIDQIESLIQKRADVGADRVVVISSGGYQEGAVKAAKAHGVDVHELTEDRAHWTQAIRRDICDVPFPREIEFDMPPVGSTEVPERVFGPIKFTEVEFFDGLSDRAFDLATVLRDVGVWAYEKELRLPCEVDLRFDEGTLLRPPGKNVLVPVYGLKFVLEKFRVRRERTLDIPPHAVKYKYQDAKTGAAEEIDPDEVGEALRRAPSHRK
jgi:hypothetical protein